MVYICNIDERCIYLVKVTVMKKTKTISIITYSIMVVACLLGMSLSAIGLWFNYQEAQYYIKTTGQIINIEINPMTEQMTNNSEYGDRTVEFTYVVDNVEYKAQKQTFNFNLDVGDDIVVHYNQHNPAKIIDAFSTELLCGSIVMLCVLFAISIFLLGKRVLS